MTAALAASAAFITPVSSPVNTLAVGPGNYRRGDFVRIGVPLTAVTLVTCVVLVPWVLPFRSPTPPRTPPQNVYIRNVCTTVKSSSPPKNSRAPRSGLDQASPA